MRPRLKSGHRRTAVAVSRHTKRKNIFSHTQSMKIRLRQQQPKAKSEGEAILLRWESNKDRKENSNTHTIGT